MGVVALPSRVTGLAAISMREEMTFIPECQGSSNSSQCALASGVGWRLILRRTVLELAIRIQLYSTHVGPDVPVWAGERSSPGFDIRGLKLTAELRWPGWWDTCPYAGVTYFTASYLLGRGGIRDTSTGSNSNLGSSASGANVAFVVFSQFLSSRSGKSGL